MMNFQKLNNQHQGLQSPRAAILQITEYIVFEAYSPYTGYSQILCSCFQKLCFYILVSNCLQNY